VVSIMFFSGIQLLALGIMSEYVCAFMTKSNAALCIYFGNAQVKA